MRYVIAFLILQTTVQGQCFSGGFSSGFCAPPRRVYSSYSAPVYKNEVIVKEVVREVPVLAYPVAQQYAPNPYLMQAQFKQYFSQLRRMQDELQASFAENEAFASQFQQQQTVQQAPVQQYQPPPQQYEQNYQQMPQPYGAYAPQTQPPPQYSHQQYAPPPQPQQNQCLPAAELLRMLLAPQNQPSNGYHQQVPQHAPQAEVPLEGGYASVSEARCTGCHSGPNPKGGIDMSQFGLARMSLQQRKAAFQRALLGEMPLDPNGNPQPLPPEELDALRQEMFTPAEVGTEMRNAAMRRSGTPASLAVGKSQ